MATEKAPTASEALKNLEQQLTCPVCLDRYTQPRTLPCLHSFCHNCLAHFPVQVQGGKHFMTCPVCRQTTQQPDKGVSGFQSAFLINNLLELHQVLEKVSGSQQNNCENCHKEQATGYCKQCSKFLCQTCVDTHNKWGDFSSHQILGVEDVATTASKLVPLKEQPTMECGSHGKPLEVYCDTCDELICQLCTTAKAHRDHEYEPLTDAFPRHQQQIVDSLQQVKMKLAAITTAVQAVETQEGGFLEQVGAVRREIEATVRQLMLLLQKSERQLMRELDQVTDAYVEKISGRKKEVDITIAQLKSCKDFAEEELRIGSQQEILVMKGQMVERMAAVCSQVKEENIRPLEETRVRFAKSASVLEACCSLGSVVREIRSSSSRSVKRKHVDSEPSSTVSTKKVKVYSHTHSAQGSTVCDDIPSSHHCSLMSHTLRLVRERFAGARQFTMNLHYTFNNCAFARVCTYVLSTQLGVLRDELRVLSVRKCADFHENRLIYAYLSTRVCFTPGWCPFTVSTADSSQKDWRE